MTDSLELAKKLLSEQEVGFAAVNGEFKYSSDLSGIAPIMDLLSENSDALRGASVADKVVGKAAALLFVLGGAQEVYANIISEHAAQLLTSNGITYEHNVLVPQIYNRSGTDMCPMEKAVLHTDEPGAGYMLLKQAIARLQRQ